MDEALFDSQEKALRFAFWGRRPIVDGGNALANMITDLDKRKPTGLGLLTPHERVAQAGMILGFVSRLPPAQRAYIHARYMRGIERSRAQRVLANEIMPMITGLTYRHMIYELVARHYGKDVKLVWLAERFNVHENTVTKKVRAIEGLLRVIESQADAAISEYLLDGGLLRREF